MKHTPGPWKAYERPNPRGYARFEIHYTDDGECVAEVVHEEADALLMSASPELLEACKEALELIERLVGGGLAGLPTRNQLKRAIAKATGEEGVR